MLFRSLLFYSKIYCKYSKIKQYTRSIKQEKREEHVTHGEDDDGADTVRKTMPQLRRIAASAP